jgi:hypothetical protein
VFSMKKASVGPVSTLVIVIALVCLMGLMYLSQITKTNTYGYEITSLSSREKSLKIVRSDLEIESIKLQSMDRVKASEAAAKLVPLQPSQYANP